VVADFSHKKNITADDLIAIGYQYNKETDKWAIADAAADYIYIGAQQLNIALPGTLRVIVQAKAWEQVEGVQKQLPIFNVSEYLATNKKSTSINFVQLDCYSDKVSITDDVLTAIASDPTVVFCMSSQLQHAMPAVRRRMIQLMQLQIQTPVVFVTDSAWHTTDEHLIHFATETGALFLDGMGDGICLGLSETAYENASMEMGKVSGRNYVNNTSIEQFLNATAFGILQATRTRISKTEYISCPSCGRTLFELQETTAKIRKVTNHLKGLKIAIMGCIVNGPGEMADADFGYVGSGVGKITLYKGKEVMKRNIDSAIAVDELVQLLKENNAWVDPK
jgi:(E)-4-hydroxy-3-methylbut-2-enyl-diphosphate synthase